MSKENTWINTRTRVITGVNKPPGSPRAWVLRALDSASHEITQSLIRPKLISVAAIWTRPNSTIDFPYTSLIRFFDMQIDQRNNKWVPRPPTTPCIGRAWQIPIDHVLPAVRELMSSSALMVWWCTPERDDPTAKPDLTGLKVRLKLDHEELFTCFDRGQRPHNLAHERGLSPNAVRYVFQKWKAARGIERPWR